MRAVVQEAKQFLTVGANFFRLVELSPTSTRIRLGYSVNQQEVLKAGITSVRVTAYTDKEPVRDITELSSHAATDELIDNVLLYHQRVRDTARKNAEKIVFQYNSDFTKKINNALIRGIKAGTDKVVKRTISVEKLRLSNSIVIGQNGLSIVPSPDHNTQNLALTLITSDCVDPSDVTTIGKQVIPVHDLIDGIRTVPVTKTPHLVEYLKSVIAASTPVDARTDVGYSHVIASTDTIDVFDEIQFPVKLDSFSEIFFSFEALDATGASVNTIVKKVRTERELNAFRTPIVPPAVSISPAQSPGKGMIIVTQRDDRAHGIQVFRRTLNHSRPIELEKYVLVSEVKLSPEDGTQQVSIDIDSSSSTIFRVIATGEHNVQSAEFTSVILPPNDDIARLMPENSTVSGRRFVHVSLTSRITANGIALDVRELPYDVITVQVQRRDVTANEREFSPLDIVSVVDRRDVYTFQDTSVENARVYEYRCIINFSDGTVTDCGREIVEFVPLSTDLVDTRIESVEVINDGRNYDVRFSVVSSLVPTTLDSIKSVMQKQDVLKYFDNDILAEREKLQGLLAHMICRVNLTTGERESFGIITDAQFSDAEQGPRLSVTPLEQGNRYRYEVTTLLRQPETMLGKFEKTVIDDLSKRTYTFSPSKYLHPITLGKGNIVSDKSLSANHAKDSFSFGNTGSVAITDVNLEQPPVSVSNLSAMQVNADIVEVSWNVTGDTDTIDHFLIAKSTLDGREIVGKSHTQHESGEFYFLHSLRRHDIGEITYIIIPVLANYDKGTEVVSNKIFITTPEIHFTAKATMISGMRKIS